MKKNINKNQITQSRLNNVALFPEKNKQRHIPVPLDRHDKKDLITYEVCGESLVNDGIENGDTLIVNTLFELSDITPDKISVLRINNEIVAKRALMHESGKCSIMWREKYKFFYKAYEPGTFEIVGYVAFNNREFAN